MTNDRLQQEIEAIRADVAKLGEDMGELTRVIHALGEERIKDVRDSVEESVDTADEELRRRVEAAREQSRQATEEIEKAIVQHPLGSLLGAFSIGVVVAQLLNPGGRR
ncbi:MAG TPA: DUF883 family protein [Gammaproteobacteria bacterium]|nr:DUF883 family protein [Gammaproteobacteria bacterium]